MYETRANKGCEDEHLAKSNPQIRKQKYCPPPGPRRRLWTLIYERASRGRGAEAEYAGARIFCVCRARNMLHYRY